MNYIKSQSSKKLKGYRSISNPDIAISLSKKLSYINRTAVMYDTNLILELKQGGYILDKPRLIKIHSLLRNN